MHTPVEYTVSMHIFIHGAQFQCIELIQISLRDKYNGENHAENCIRYMPIVRIKDTTVKL